MREKEPIIGVLDTGTCKTCFILARALRDGRLEMLASGFSNSSGLNKGVVVNVGEAAASIRQAAREVESKSGLSATRVVAGISGTHLQSYNFRGTVEVRGNHCVVTPEDRDNAVCAARSIPLSPAREIIHVLPREFFVNKRGGIADPVGLSGSLLDADLHLISCDRPLGQSLVNAANKAEIEVKRLIAQSLASAEAVLMPEEKQLGAAVIDIGGGTTDIAVYLEDKVYFTSVIGAGGTHFTRDLVRGIHVTHEEAERVKIESGSVLPEEVEPDEVVSIEGLGMRGPRDYALRAICANLRARGEELLELVREDVLRSGVRDNLVAGAVITGGGSMMRGLSELAERILEMPVRRGLPLGFIGLEKELAHPTYACAVGLAILEAQQASQKDVLARPPVKKSLIEKILSWFES